MMNGKPSKAIKYDIEQSEIWYGQSREKINEIIGITGSRPGKSEILATKNDYQYKVIQSDHAA